MIAAREGSHFGDGQWALVKSTPLEASLSIFGVHTYLRNHKAIHPVLHVIYTKNRTLGFCFDAALKKNCRRCAKNEVAKNKPLKRYKQLAQEDFIDVNF